MNVSNVFGQSMAIVLGLGIAAVYVFFQTVVAIPRRMVPETRTEPL